VAIPAGAVRGVEIFPFERLMRVMRAMRATDDDNAPAVVGEGDRPK